LSGSAGGQVQDLTQVRRLVRAVERGLERRLFRGLLRAQEREPEWLPLQWQLRQPQQRLDWRLQRVVKRGLLKVEDSHLLGDVL